MGANRHRRLDSQDGSQQNVFALDNRVNTYLSVPAERLAFRLTINRSSRKWRGIFDEPAQGFACAASSRDI